MVAITQELLRRRAEHNDGELSSLQEITLHQFDIEKIELIQECCRQLRLLYLQSNQIMKIENLNKLKSLEYLNLALNNIRRIENLQGCESLRKLDLTVNFVEDVRCVESLRGNEELRELYRQTIGSIRIFLVGNPCATKSYYRAYIIATLPQLQSLDGTPITKSERIQAQHAYPQLLKTLEEEFGKEDLDISTIARNAEVTQEAAKETKSSTDAEETGKSSADDEIVPHTPEARLAAAREMAAKRSRHDPDVPPPKPKAVEAPPPKFGEDGRIQQRNAPKCDFELCETDTHLELQVQLSPFLDTSLVDLTVERNWVRVVVKGKPLDLALPSPVDKARSNAVRTQSTGALTVRMVKEGVTDQQLFQQEHAKTFTGYVCGKKNVSDTAKVDYRNIVKPEEPMSAKENCQTANVAKPSIHLLHRSAEPSKKAIERKLQAEREFIDDEEVPALE